MDRKVSMRKARVLVIGAGASGSVFGYYIREAGAELSFYVKPKYAGLEEEGLCLHEHHLRNDPDRWFIDDFDVFTRPEQLAGHYFDQIWLCISSTALRGDWLAPIIENGGKRATIVSVQPGLEDRQYLVDEFGEERVVSGQIGFIAYQAPLPGQDLWPEGIAYWLPPLSPSPFFGPDEERLLAVVELLQRGGLPAQVKKDTIDSAAIKSAALIPSVVFLEIHDWSFEAARRDTAGMKALCAAIGEAIDGVCSERNFDLGLKRKLVHPFVATQVVKWGPKVSPLPLSMYLRFHFTKVRDQTAEMMARYLRICAEQDVPSRHLEELLDRWPEEARPLPERPRPDYDEEGFSEWSADRPTGALPAVETSDSPDGEEPTPSGPVRESTKMYPGTEKLEISASEDVDEDDDTGETVIDPSQWDEAPELDGVE